MHPLLAMARQIALWNALIPKRATRIDVGVMHTRYLDPTKGWRSIANDRLGLCFSDKPDLRLGPLVPELLSR